MRRGHRRHSALVGRLRVVVREQVIAGPEVDIELGTARGSLADRDRELAFLVAWEGFSVAGAVSLPPGASATRKADVLAAAAALSVMLWSVEGMFRLSLRFVNHFDCVGVSQSGDHSGAFAPAENVAGHS